MKKVLIVDPAEPFVQFLKLVLARLGYEAVHEKNAERALLNLPRIKPEMIISEVKLPAMSGIELCEIIKKDSSLCHIPVAILSLSCSEETKLHAQQAGCIDFLTKPVTPRALYELMERQLPYDYKRQNVRAKMITTALVHDGNKSMELRTNNVGEGGLYLDTAQPSTVGAKLTITLPLPGLNSPLSLQGEVVYVDTENENGVPRGIGVKFIGMDENMTPQLRQYMMSYLSDFMLESPKSV